MFIILLRFSANKDKAPSLMAGHKAWVKQGLDEGAFLMVGSLQPAAGGAILANAASMADMQHRVEQDPFVQEGVVSAEILEITPNQAADRLQFLLA